MLFPRQHAFLFVVAALAGCGSASEPVVPPAAASVQIVAAPGTGATVGTTSEVQVRPLTASGATMPGQAVTFNVTAGGGSVSVSSSAADAAGVARAHWTLGTTSGEQRLTVGAGSATAQITANTVGGPIESLALATAPPLTVPSRALWSPQPVVQLKDRYGNVATSSGTVTVSASSGTLSGTTSVTGANGQATFNNLSLSGVVGPRTITFSAPGAASITAPVTLVAGPAATIAANGSTTFSGVTGTALTATPSVRIADADGNAVAGAAVTFAVASGGGTVAGASTTTNASGIASIGSWTLGAVGANTLTATAAGLSGSPVLFTATATPAPTTCGQSALLEIGQSRPGNLVASQCTLTSDLFWITNPQFSGPQAGGTFFYDHYVIDIPAGAIVQVTVTRGSLPFGQVLIALDAGGRYVSNRSFDPLTINNSAGATARFQILLTHFQPGTTGTYTIAVQRIL